MVDATESAFRRFARHQARANLAWMRFYRLRGWTPEKATRDLFRLYYRRSWGLPDA